MNTGSGKYSVCSAGDSTTCVVRLGWFNFGILVFVFFAEVVEFLGKVALLQGLNTSSLNRIAQVLVLKRYGQYHRYDFLFYYYYYCYNGFSVHPQCFGQREGIMWCVEMRRWRVFIFSFKDRLGSSFCVFGKYYIFQKGFVCLNSVFFFFCLSLCFCRLGLWDQQEITKTTPGSSSWNHLISSAVVFLGMFTLQMLLLSHHRYAFLPFPSLLFFLYTLPFVDLLNHVSLLFSLHACCSCLTILLCLTPTPSLIQIRNNPVL